MTARDRTVIAVVCALAAIAASWLFVIQPKRDQAGKLGAAVKAEQSQLDSVRAQLAAGEAARTSFAKSYTTLVKLGEAVPVDDNVPSLIYQLQGAASSTKVDFRALSLVPSSGSPSPTSSRAATQASTASLPRRHRGSGWLPG